MNWFRLIRRHFTPSKTLANYMMKMYLFRFLGILIGLTAVLQLLDLLTVTDDIMAADGATFASIISYLSMRTPQIISLFVPFVALLATLLTLATLNQNSEVIVMKAMGLSAHRILLPLGKACAIIGVSHFAFNEMILTPATAELDYWRSNDYAINLPPPEADSHRVWLTEDETLVLVNSVSRSGDRIILDQVSLFERSDEGNLQAVLKADFAWHQDGQWTLYDVRRFNAITHALTIQESLSWDIKTPPERFLALTVEPKHVNSLEILASIKQLDKEGLPTDTLMTEFLHKFTGPLSTLLMPLLGALAAFGVHRAGNLFLRLIFGMALGFSFFVADNFMLAMGQFGVAPPFLAAFSSFLIFMTVGYAVLFHSEEGGNLRIGLASRDK